MLKTENGNRNKYRFITTAALLGASALLLSACGGGSGSSGGGDTAYNAATLQEDTADNVVVAIYSDLDTEASTLQTEVSELVSGITDGDGQGTLETKLQEARDAWIATRDPWEKSEAFLYGPVDTQGFDPRLDSWPLNKTDLDSIISGSETIDDAFIDDQDNNVRGFHTVEYLLWSDGSGNEQDGLTAVVDALEASPRRQDYLEHVTKDIADTATALYDAWRSGSGDYAATLATAGEDGNTVYQSQRAAVQEIIQGMVTIANEVGTGKLKPGDETKVESWYSYNSREDFMDDIRGIRAVYTGDYDSHDGPGVADYVKAVGSSKLHNEVISQIDDAITQIDNINQPFRDHFDSSQTDAAIDAVVELRDTLENDLLALLDDTDFER
jgi:uncharacterized iron-regulated protein